MALVADLTTTKGHMRKNCENSRVVNRDHIADVNPDEALAKIKIAARERDVDDVKEAVQEYVKSVGGDVNYHQLQTMFIDEAVNLWLIATERQLVNVFTNMDLQGNTGKKYSISYRFSEKPERPREIEGWPKSREEILDRLEDAGEIVDSGHRRCHNCATSPEHAALQHLLSRLMTDAGIFTWAAALIPSTLPLPQDPTFQHDRTGFFGTKEGRNPARDGDACEMASLFGFIERTLLAEGREWTLGTTGPRLADIEALGMSLPEALPRGEFSREVYPRVYAWMERFNDAARRARERNARGVLGVKGEEAARLLVRREREREGEEGYHEAPSMGIDDVDFETRSRGGLREGDEVVVGPTDTGLSGRDVGRLAGLTAEEVVYETHAGDGVLSFTAEMSTVVQVKDQMGGSIDPGYLGFLQKRYECTKIMLFELRADRVALFHLTVTFPYPRWMDQDAKSSLLPSGMEDEFPSGFKIKPPAMLVNGKVMVHHFPVIVI
ncbi:hypothetical protein E4U43_002732 [Claviceps pusilla]|uniref:DUF7962 domain-containing protein n=1 Tax=Claviceps pusilla TaxID=123648 RepID=A0A9P7NFR5_9HYPO|nr:hypothetical protein E4U43_002732 [Claviceps pusilla]